jgi:uncharacterized membrane protein
MAEEVPVNTAPKDYTDEKPLRIRRGRVDSVDLYEIKENELDLLEKGSPAGLYLNFAIFLLTIAFSSLSVLCTVTTFINDLMQTVFVVVTVVGFLLGVLLLILWYRGREDVIKVIKNIRNRIPPEVSSTPSGGAGEELVTEEQPEPPEPKG